MRELRSIVKRALPSSVLQGVRDFKYISTPEGRPDGRVPLAKGVNIARSYYYPKTTIYFLPDRPMAGSVRASGVYRGAVAYKLCRLLGYGITTKARGYDVVFKNRRATFSDPLSSAQFGGRYVINGKNTDISKRTVSDTFEEVFGYAVGVDPTTYEGKIVVKSNMNSVHDGHVVEGPIAPEEVQDEYAYQRAIDNTIPGRNLVLDYRVPVHGDRIPLVYLKYRPTESRFVNRSTHAAVKAPPEVFSDDEVDKILRFAWRMGIDFGEFDVLRDRDGRIYVVDANPVPWGLPSGLSAADRGRALSRMGASFEALIQQYAGR